MSIEVRCATDDKLLLVASDDFVGAVSTKCGRCKEDVAYPAGARVLADRLHCSCGKWLACGLVEVGWVQVRCSRDIALARVGPAGAILTELSRARRPKPPRIDALVAMVAARWDAWVVAKAQQRADVAVGLRFDVFSRDGFRCRYCGRGPAQGVLLEVDHVVPRAAGGGDSLANLVTACADCNRGKAAKVLATGVTVPPSE